MVNHVNLYIDNMKNVKPVELRMFLKLQPKTERIDVWQTGRIVEKIKIKKKCLKREKEGVALFSPEDWKEQQ